MMKKFLLPIILLTGFSLVGAQDQSWMNRYNDFLAEEKEKNGSGGQNQQPAPKRVINIPTHWGAVAIDVKKGIGGVAENVRSERLAKKKSIQECKKRGGEDCKILGLVKNSCLSYGVGTRKDSTMFVQFAGGKSTQEAEKAVMQRCQSEEKMKCEIYYSHCNKDPRYDMY